MAKRRIRQTTPQNSLGIAGAKVQQKWQIWSECEVIVLLLIWTWNFGRPKCVQVAMSSDKVGCIALLRGDACSRNVRKTLTSVDLS